MSRNGVPGAACVLHANTRVRNFGDCILVHRTEELADDKYTSYLWVIPPIEPRDAATSSKLSWAQKLKQFVTAKKFVFSGGGYFTAPASPSLKWQARNIVLYALPLLVLRAFNRDVQVGIFGVGFGKLPRLYGCALSLAIPKNAEITVRDVESLCYAQNFSSNVVLGADLALTCDYEQQRAEEPRKGTPRILCHVSKTNYADTEIFRPLTEFLNSLSDVDLVFVTDTKGNNDNEQDRILRKFRREFPDASFYPYKNVGALRRTIDSCDAVITTKLHIAIIATVCEKKLLSIPCHPKIARFFRDIGLENQAFDYSTDLNTWLSRTFHRVENTKLPSGVISRANLTEKRLIDFLCS